MSGITVATFYQWERASRDTIDVKRCYIDAAGDLVAGILLSQIVYWFLPSEGGSKLRVHQKGETWLVKTRADWWSECRISPRQFDRAIAILRSKGFVKTDIFRFSGSPTIHIQLVVENLVASVNSILTKREVPNGRKRNMDIDTLVSSLTETTAETNNKDNLSSVVLDNASVKSLHIWTQTVIETWYSVKGFHETNEDCLELLGRLAKEFSDIDIVAESKAWAARKLSEPLVKRSKPLGQIWNWMRKAKEFRGEKYGKLGKNRQTTPENTADSLQKSVGIALD